ncbi:hypothetical protein [Amycolatopsis sp. SID8362]|uniref:hypothetical protein n=1 Tax=Amycolatopsis sp. SID8362 TaxID=2690346 RepID=UPI00136BF5DB|nr:hypothetical protein [Amycolatopsis sp. SID8362]NBH01806.1 hypothetical protein [Amycolatopsis sp. SID8362]NED38508.1 hypothetical protein [Amycolatopsis sp. SID8362]
MRTFTDLTHVRLEDSYVLGIRETPDSLAFTLDLVLTGAHPRYHEPRVGEQYCYADAVLTIAGVQKVEWVSRSSQTYRDASGEEDLGNIDSFRYQHGCYDITGDWGHVRVHSPAEPRVTFPDS